MVGSGYEKVKQKHTEGETWIEDGRTWTIKNGLRQNVTKLDGVGSAINRAVVVNPGERMMISTGIVFDIPVGYSVRVHARSGLALKAGLVMANAEGVIDSDYTEETKILVLNISNIPIRINHGDRIAQAEMVPVLSYDLVSTTEDINQKTSRAGGFGSTGIS